MKGKTKEIIFLLSCGGWDSNPRASGYEPDDLATSLPRILNNDFKVSQPHILSISFSDICYLVRSAPSFEPYAKMTPRGLEPATPALKGLCPNL